MNHRISNGVQKAFVFAAIIVLSTATIAFFCLQATHNDSPLVLPKNVKSIPDDVSYDASLFVSDLQELIVCKGGSAPKSDSRLYYEYRLDSVKRVVYYYRHEGESLAEGDWVETSRHLSDDAYSALLQRIKALNLLQLHRQYWRTDVADGTHMHLVVRFTNTAKMCRFGNYYPQQLRDVERLLSDTCWQAPTGTIVITDVNRETWRDRLRNPLP